MSTSVVRRSSMRGRNPLPIACLNRPMVASTLANLIEPAMVILGSGSCRRLQSSGLVLANSADSCSD